MSSTYCEICWDLWKQARGKGREELAEMAWRAYHHFDTARAFRKVRNQHPKAKSEHAKGVRLYKRLERLMEVLS